MRNVASHPELSALLSSYDALNGVLDYVWLKPHDTGPPHACHRAAALAGMTEIDRRLEQWAVQHASKQYPVERFRVRWDDAKLTGEPISLATFWGTDDVEPTPLGDHAWGLPDVDGYKTAFFLPPYGLLGSACEQADLFTRINRYVLGAAPDQAEIFSWSTDWSNYFEAGHEWWGAFYWTIRPAGSQRLVVVGASTSD